MPVAVKSTSSVPKESLTDFGRINSTVSMLTLKRMGGLWDLHKILLFNLKSFEIRDFPLFNIKADEVLKGLLIIVAGTL